MQAERPDEDGRNGAERNGAVPHRGCGAMDNRGAKKAPRSGEIF